MKKFLIALALGTIFHSSVRALGPEDLEFAVQKDGDILWIHWRDVAPRTNSCGFSVQRFSYLPSRQTLSLFIHRDICDFDFLDRSRGVHPWKIPFGLTQASEMALNVQGRPAGVITWEDERVQFSRPKPTTRPDSQVGGR